VSHKSTLPIVNVLLTEDRGMVTRRGVVDWHGRAGTVLIEGVSALIVDSSIQYKIISGAGSISSVSVRRAWVPRTRPEASLIADLNDQIQHRKQEAEKLNADLQRVIRHGKAAEHALLLYADHIAHFASLGQSDPQRWQKDVAALQDRLLSNVAQVNTVEAAREDVAEALANLDGALARLTRGELVLESSIAVSWEAEAGPVSLEISYLLPSAVWRPTYEADLRRDSDGRASVVFRVMATVWQRTGVDWEGVNVTLSTARPSAGAKLPTLNTDRLSLRAKTREERKTIAASFRDQAISQASLTDASPSALPGVDDGGETRVLTVGCPASVASNGRPHRLSVASFQAPAEARYKCVPALKTLVYLVAELQNQMSGPILAGPVTLLVDGDLVGVGKIPFVAAGEHFPVSFGSEDDISVQYLRTRKTEERFAQKDQLWFHQRVTVRNMGTTAREIELVLRVPVSELKQVKVLLQDDLRSDEQGMLKNTVHVKPGEEMAWQVAFRLEKSGKVELSDPW